MLAENRLPLLIGLVLAGWLLYLLAPILTPFVAAGLLAYVGDPLVDRLERFKLPRSLSVAVVFVLLLLAVGALTLLVVPLARAQVSEGDIARSDSPAMHPARQNSSMLSAGLNSA